MSSIAEKAARVTYDKSDTQRINAFETFADGAVVKVVIEEASLNEKTTLGEGPGNDFFIKLRLSVLDPEDGVTRLRPQLYASFTLPIRDPDHMDTHVPPSWASGLWAEFCRGFISERHPDKPRQEQGRWKFKGKNINRSDIPSITEELGEELLAEAKTQLVSNASDLVNRFCYATITHAQSKEGDNIFVNASKLRPELFNGESLTGKKDLKVKVLSGEKVESSKKEEKGKTKRGKRR